ncbi:MAG: hypothetical protein EOO11_15450, partial [Chitinophagaceae bacterium]
MTLHRLFLFSSLLLGTAAGAQKGLSDQTGGGQLPTGGLFVPAAQPAARAASTPVVVRSARNAVASVTAIGNVHVTATAGTATADYSTLSEAFAAINAGTHQGEIVLTIVGNTVETAQATLLGSGGASNYSSVRVQPSGHRSISGNLATVLVNLAGADNVTIDGINSADHSLTFSNSNTDLAAGTVRFLDDASNNTLTNCTVLG